MAFKRREKPKSHFELQGDVNTVYNVNGQGVFISKDKLPCKITKPKGSIRVTHAIDNQHHVTSKDLKGELVTLLPASEQLKNLAQKEAVHLRCPECGFPVMVSEIGNTNKFIFRHNRHYYE